MTKLNKVVLNEVELKNVKNVGVLVVEKVGVAGTKDDKRTNNPGRPVNKKSARYKRLAKQAKYALALSKFTQGCSFKLSKEKSQLFKYSISSGESYGCIVSKIGGHVCNIDYVGRTKATGYTFVLDKKVNVELNLKTLVFVSK
tara:strand:- start:61 stop:489 length:429 start_codon:yes stop_codon:yes gene_type:complete